VLAALLAAGGFLALTLGGVAPTGSPLSLPWSAVALLGAALSSLGAGHPVRRHVTGARAGVTSGRVGAGGGA
jgi:hypothetical protein